jgi:hypothetical protein
LEAGSDDHTSHREEVTTMSVTGVRGATQSQHGLARWERVARAAVGNAVGFLPLAGELLVWFKDAAWLPPYSWVLGRRGARRYSPT